MGDSSFHTCKQNRQNSEHLNKINNDYQKERSCAKPTPLGIVKGILGGHASTEKMEGGGLNSEYADGIGSTLGYLNDWEVYLGVEYMLNTENKTQASLGKNKWRGHILYPIAQTEMMRQLREGIGVAKSIEYCRTEQVALVVPIWWGGTLEDGALPGKLERNKYF